MTTVDIASEMLDIGAEMSDDNSIESYEFREYESQNPAAINNGQAIQIDIQNQHIFTQPSKSYLHVEGRLASTTNVAYAGDTLVTLINNAIPFMFSQIRYLVNNTEIENIASPGQATTMKGLLVYGDDFSKAEGLNMCWQKDTSAAAADANLGFAVRRAMIITRPDPIGTFSFVIPLSHLFGFCDDYHRVVYGIKHSLLLSRQADTDAIFKADAIIDGKITLSKLSWFMPHVIPALEYKSMLMKQIEAKVKVPVAFRAMQCDNISVPQATTFSWRLSVKSGTEKPRWILVSFQTGKTAHQRQNPALFDHVQVRSIYAMLNSDRYPVVDMNLDFAAKKISRAYKALRDFKEEYCGIDGRESSCQITPIDFVDFFPIFVLDVRRQSERLKTTTQDIQIKVNFDAAVPANTTAYAVLISDRLLKLESDGSKFNVVY